MIREKQRQPRNGISSESTGRRLVPSLVSILVLLLSCHDTICAQAHKLTEYDVKAAYLYNFGRFVRWPAPLQAASNGSFQICVLGKSPFQGELENIARGESIDGKRLLIGHIGAAREASECRILFISSSEEHNVEAALAEVAKRPILTVSDIPDFVDRGGHIEFVEMGGKIRFKVNLTAAANSGLTMSSDLLKVAVAVKRDGPVGD